MLNNFASICTTIVFWNSYRTLPRQNNFFPHYNLNNHASHPLFQNALLFWLRITFNYPAGVHHFFFFIFSWELFYYYISLPLWRHLCITVFNILVLSTRTLRFHWYSVVYLEIDTWRTPFLSPTFSICRTFLYGS